MWNKEINYEIEGEDGTRITCVSLQTLENMVKRLQKDFDGAPSEQILIPFEFVIGSLFPNAYNNIKDAMSQQYIEGYNAASLISYEEVESNDP